MAKPRFSADEPIEIEKWKFDGWENAKNAADLLRRAHVVRILYYLDRRDMRPAELERELDSQARPILAALERLIDVGLVERRRVNRQCVHYCLTGDGQELIPLLRILGDWFGELDRDV